MKRVLSAWFLGFSLVAATVMTSAVAQTQVARELPDFHL
jgi:hypothetical protein